MQKFINDKIALLIIDMVKDNFDESKKLPITPYAKEIIKPINNLIHVFRQRSLPIVFSTDAFTTRDFFFTGLMKPHSLKGSVGAEIVDELDRQPQDYCQQKPSMSAFFKTGLEDWLRRNEVTTCAVAGIATQFCVLASAIDALCHDFRVVFLQDCTAAGSTDIQTAFMSVYQRNPLYPLFRITSSEQLIDELNQGTSFLS